MDDDPGLLWQAAWDGNAYICLELLKKHSHIHGYVDHQDERSGTTPLCGALRNSYRVSRGKYFLVVKHLLQYGANVSVVCDDGSTALHWAVENAPLVNDDFIHPLFESCPYLDVNVKVDGATPLMTALSCPVYSRPQVSELLKHGARVNTIDKNGNSLLHQRTVDEWELDTLKSYHIDIDRKCNGRTPLHHAIHQYRWHPPSQIAETVELLLSRGASINITDEAGRTAQELAVFLLPEDSHIREMFTSRAVPFAMGHHRRLGEGSRLMGLDPEMLRMILYQL